MKKKTSLKSPGVKLYTIGKGFTEKRKYSIDLAGSLSPEGRALLEKGPKGLNPFDGKISLAEASARRILEQAGLPTDPSGFYTIPEGEKVPMPRTHEETIAVLSRSSERKAGNLLDLVKARKYRERVDSEWYAAEILSTARTVRANIGDPWTSAALAADLGELVGEARAWGYFAQKGKGGKKPEKNPVINTYVRDRLRRNPKLSAAALFRAIPRDEFKAIQIGNSKLFVDGDRLCVTKKQGKNWIPAGDISFDTFRNYVTQAR